jgi:hypothetical protein
MSKISTAVAAFVVSGFMGLACRGSGLKSGARDAGAASGGQAASTISSEATGGSGRTIGTGGAGGGSIGVPVSAHCGNGKLDPGEECDDGVPFARKLDPNGIPFDDGCSALCQIEVGWQCPTPGQPCIPCDTGTMNVCDAGPVGYCGDGIIQTNLGEECDSGLVNGQCVDVFGTLPDGGQGNSGDAGCPLASWNYPDGTQGCDCPAGTVVVCTTTCRIPYYLP